MSITRRAKSVVASAALLGAALSAGTAFTAGGVSLAGAPPSEFIGGSVEQVITGATITNIAYDVDEAANKIVSVQLIFGDGTADGKTPVVAFAGAAENGEYTCTAVDAETNVSTCGGGASPEDQADTNVSGLTITVV